MNSQDLKETGTAFNTYYTEGVYCNIKRNSCQQYVCEILLTFKLFELRDLV